MAVICCLLLAFFCSREKVDSEWWLLLRFLVVWEGLPLFASSRASLLALLFDYW